MKVIYNTISGRIVGQVSDETDYLFNLQMKGEGYLSKLDHIVVDNYLSDMDEYYVADGVLVKYPDGELLEVREYGRLLTNEERQLNKLKPSVEEVQRAEQTIEVLSLIQEVI